MTPLEALERARTAWEATQPQLILELWDDRGLCEGAPVGRAPSQSPPAASHRPAGGLNHGTGATPRQGGVTATPLPHTAPPHAPPPHGRRASAVTQPPQKGPG